MKLLTVCSIVCLLYSQIFITSENVTNLIIFNSSLQYPERDPVFETLKLALKSNQLVLCDTELIQNNILNDQSIVSQYDIRQVADNYVMFIPKDLSKKAEQQIQNNSLLSSYKLLPVDVAVGMRVSSLPAYKTKNLGEKSLSTVLEKLAIGDLRDLNKSSSDLLYIIPQINIILEGHGSHIGDSIAGLKVLNNELGLFFKVLKKCYFVKSLIIISCYSGLTMQRYMQEAQKSISVEKINFPIILLTGNNAAFVQKIDLIAPNYFVELFSYLNKSEGADYIALIDYLSFESGGDIVNYGSVKYPNTSWFSFLDVKNKVKVLGHMVAMFGIPAGSKSISVDKNIQYLLLRSEYIPSKINLEANCDGYDFFIMPAIVDQVEVQYYIEEINHNNCGDFVSFVKFFANHSVISNSQQRFKILINNLVLANKKYEKVTIVCTDTIFYYAYAQDNKKYTVTYNINDHSLIGKYLDWKKPSEKIDDLVQSKYELFFEMDKKDVIIPFKNKFYMSKIKIFSSGKKGIDWQREDFDIDTYITELNTVLQKKQKQTEDVFKQNKNNQNLNILQSKNTNTINTNTINVPSFNNNKQFNIQAKPVQQSNLIYFSNNLTSESLAKQALQLSMKLL